jgi:hypothetical protein
LRYQVSVLVGRKLKQEVRWEPTGVALDLLVQALSLDAVKAGQILVQHDPLAPDRIDQRLDMGWLEHRGGVVGYHGPTLSYRQRHKCLRRRLRANMSPLTISERLMHSSVALTRDTYSHVLPTMQRTAADQQEAILFG